MGTIELGFSSILIFLLAITLIQGLVVALVVHVVIRGQRNEPLIKTRETILEPESDEVQEPAVDPYKV